MQQKGDYLILFSCCFITKGISRSTISDIQRQELFFLPNKFADFLNDCISYPYRDVAKKYENKFSHEELETFLNFVEENDLCFFTDQPELFPKIEKKFECPALISNAILDVNENSKHNYKEIFEELDKVGCRDIQIRFYNSPNIDELVHILRISEECYNIKSIELLIRFSDHLTKEKLVDLTNVFIFIKNITVHSSPNDEICNLYSKELRGAMGNIIFVKQEITSNDHCGIISSSYFNFGNITSYMENQFYNSCLNQKIGIDVDGSIKNCPSLKSTFGNIQTDNLLEICNSKKFQEIWKTTKSQIDVCKSCEFRNNCSDCRAFTEEEKYLGKPEKCNYDPVSMVWQ